MNYRRAVSEARRLVKRSEEDSWRLAELTAQVLASGITARQWASDVGWKSHTSVQTYRKVWESFGHVRDHTRFADAYATVKTGATELVSSKDVGSFSRQRPPEHHGDKVAMARKLLTEPEVATDALREPKVRASVVRASRSVDEEMTDSAKARERERSPGLVNRATEYEVIGELTSVRYKLNRVLEKMRHLNLDDEVRESILEVFSEVENSMGWIKSFLESGDRSFDKALDRLLQEEGRGR